MRRLAGGRGVGRAHASSEMITSLECWEDMASGSSPLSRQ